MNERISDTPELYDHPPAFVTVMDIRRLREAHSFKRLYVPYIFPNAGVLSPQRRRLIPCNYLPDLLPLLAHNLMSLALKLTGSGIVD